MSDPQHDRFADNDNADEDNADEYAGLFSQLAEANIQPPHWKDKYAHRKISPRIRLAAKYYNSGIAPTLGEAARLAGLHPGTLYAMNVSDNEEYKRIGDQAAKNADIATGEISIVLQRLGRNALQTIEDLRINADKDETKLKAAIDLADRSPETSKIQKLQVQSISLDGKDVEVLTRSLVEAAEVQGRFTDATTGDYVKVTPPDQLELQHSLPQSHPASPPPSPPQDNNS